MDVMRRSSTKRMQPSSSLSHPLSGVTTRSKYHFLHHRSHSSHLLRSDLGRTKGPHHGLQSSGAGCRSDSFKYSSEEEEDDDEDMLLISELCKKAKLNQESSVGDDDEPSRVLIKDLRARRVYSPQSVGGSFSNSCENVDPKESRIGSSCRDQKMVDSGFGSVSTTENTCRAGEVSKRDGEIDNLSEGLPSEVRSRDEIDSILCSIVKEYRSENDCLNSDDALDTGNEETESPVVEFPYKAQNLDHANHGSASKGKGMQCFNDGNDGRGTSERISSLNEVPELTTPPDIEMCGNIEVHVKGTQLTGNTKENAEEPSCPKADNKNDSILKSKSVLRPRLQRKLFKTPGSVSYRRLLPFIMDMTKDDSGTSILGDCQNDEKAIDAKQFLIPLSSENQEASKDQLKTDNCPVNATADSIVLADNSDLSGGNKSKMTSYQDLPESPMQSSAKEVALDCSFVPSVNEHKENVEISLECSSNTKADLAVDFHCGRDAAYAEHNDDFKQYSKHSNVHGGNAEATDGGDTSEKICVLKQESLSPPDANMCGEDKNTPGSTDHHVNSMDLTRSPQATAEERSCAKATEGKDSILKSQSVFKPCLQKKLFKTPGSVSYKRLLPFLKDIAKDNCGVPKLGRHQKDETGMFAKRSQLPLLFHSNEATTELETDSCPMHDTVDESNAIQDMASVDPANELSYSNQPVVTSSQVLPEFPTQLNAKVAQECVSAPSVMRDGSKPKTTMVLNPRLQIDFLKHTGSFSYRRLLPFLKNITKDNSCATTNDHNPKLEKYLDETTPPPNSALDDQVAPINDPNGFVVSMEHCTGNSATEKKVLPDPDGSLNNSSPEVISAAQILVSQASHDKLIQLQDEQVLFNGDCNFESSPDSPISRLDSPMISSSPISNEVITREDATSASHQSSVYSEAERNSFNGEMRLNADGCCQKFQTNASEQQTISIVGFKKGILKRNPRGCRGLCTCLNCASFRLHAERAFEFSRNQLLDAEEVALDLMKELSHLRNMLERRTDGANNLSVLDENQVKEACRKAFAAEQLAKDRLSQMNDDLNIHCRITCSQQPRVRFANYIEEKVISPGR